MLFITSCTMEKRVYMSGYNIEWNKSKNINKQDSASDDHWKQKEQKHIREDEKPQDVIKYTDNDNPYNDDNITASNNNIIVFHQKAKTNLISRYVPRVSGKEKQTSALSKPEYNKTGKVSTSAGDSKIGWMPLTGFICSVLGLVFVFFIFPLILGLPGLIFSAIAFKKTGVDDKLNRGFSLAGLIIGIVDCFIVMLLITAIIVLLFFVMM